MNLDTPVWLVMDIGCIECGEESSVVGLFKSEDDAKQALERRAENESGSYFAGGQHQVEVFRL